LPLAMCLALSTRTRDFHPLDCAHAGRTTNKTAIIIDSSPKSVNIRQSMDGKARWIDNVVIERWFRSLKTERIYTHEYLTPRALRIGIQEYVQE
jgi:transposase InsO family protein